MIGISSHVRRTAFVAFDENADGVRAERHSRWRKNWGLPRIIPSGCFTYGTISCSGLRQPEIPANAREAAASSQEIAAVDGFIPLRCLTRKLAMQKVFEMRIVRQLFERAPILFAALVAHNFARTAARSSVCSCTAESRSSEPPNDRPRAKRRRGSRDASGRRWGRVRAYRPLAMTGRTAREFRRCPSESFVPQRALLVTEFRLIVGRFPVHVKNVFFRWAQSHLRVFVAVQTPFHQQGRGLKHQRHLIDGAVWHARSSRRL